MVRFRVTISDEIIEPLDEFCEVTGASRGEVIEVLIRDFLDDLIDRVASLSGEDDEEDLEEEDEDEEEDLEE